MVAAAVSLARRLADELLFPVAAEVDRGDRVPAEVLDALAENGFYGIGAPPELSVLDLPDDESRAAVVEALAGGCLAAAFVWMQHRGALRALARSGHVAELASGRVRAGLAIGAVTRTGPPLIAASPVDGGWSLTGSAPWVTGWGMVDVLLMAARDATDQVIWSLVDAVEGPSLRVEPLDLVAVQASGTVTLRVDELVVPSARVVGTEPHADYLARDAESLTFNGFLAVGVAGRAIALLGEDGEQLAAELTRVRDRLLHAGPDDAPAARAGASELALRSAAALAVHDGSRSVLATSHAARLIREATFLLTFGTRPTIREQLLARLSASRQ
ncbi:MAG: acyl-CoA dehydrogenase family protein [Kineosporiaceae bacterium]